MTFKKLINEVLDDQFQDILIRIEKMFETYFAIVEVFYRASLKKYLSILH